MNRALSILQIHFLPTWKKDRLIKAKMHEIIWLFVYHSILHNYKLAHLDNYCNILACEKHQQDLYTCYYCYHYLSHDMTKPTKWMCAQRRLRSAWASAHGVPQSQFCPNLQTISDQCFEPGAATFSWLVTLKFVARKLFDENPTNRYSIPK